MKILGASFKTSGFGWAAIMSAVGMLMTQVGYQLDANPETVMSMPVVLEAIGILAAGIGLTNARDEKVTSERAGAK